MSGFSVPEFGYLLNPEKYDAISFKAVCSRFILLTEELLRDRQIASLQLPLREQTLALIPEICELAMEVTTIQSSDGPMQLKDSIDAERAIRFKDIFVSYIMSSERVLRDSRVVELGFPSAEEAISLVPALRSFTNHISAIPEPDPKLTLWLFRHGEWAAPSPRRIKASGPGVCG